MDPFKGRTRLRQRGYHLVNLRRRGENLLQVGQERDSVILKLLFLLHLFDDLIQWNLDLETLDLETSIIATEIGF